MSDSIDIYEELSTRLPDARFFDVISPNDKIEINYEKDEIIKRCFVEKINTGECFEIKLKDKKKIESNPLYKTWIVQWKVVGPQTNVIRNGIVEIEGITEFNKSSIQKSKQNGFKNIEKVLKNPLQFWRGY